MPRGATLAPLGIVWISRIGDAAKSAEGFEAWCIPEPQLMGRDVCLGSISREADFGFDMLHTWLRPRIGVGSPQSMMRDLEMSKSVLFLGSVTPLYAEECAVVHGQFHARREIIQSKIFLV